MHPSSNHTIPPKTRASERRAQRSLIGDSLKIKVEPEEELVTPAQVTPKDEDLQWSQVESDAWLSQAISSVAAPAVPPLATGGRKMEKIEGDEYGLDRVRQPHFTPVIPSPEAPDLPAPEVLHVSRDVTPAPVSTPPPLPLVKASLIDDEDGPGLSNMTTSIAAPKPSTPTKKRKTVTHIMSLEVDFVLIDNTAFDFSRKRINCTGMEKLPTGKYTPEILPAKRRAPSRKAKAPAKASKKSVATKSAPPRTTITATKKGKGKGKEKGKKPSLRGRGREDSESISDDDEIIGDTTSDFESEEDNEDISDRKRRRRRREASKGSLEESSISEAEEEDEMMYVSGGKGGRKRRTVRTKAADKWKNRGRRRDRERESEMDDSDSALGAGNSFINDSLESEEDDLMKTRIVFMPEAHVISPPKERKKKINKSREGEEGSSARPSQPRRLRRLVESSDDETAWASPGHKGAPTIETSSQPSLSKLSSAIDGDGSSSDENELQFLDMDDTLEERTRKSRAETFQKRRERALIQNIRRAKGIEAFSSTSEEDTDSDEAVPEDEFIVHENDDPETLAHIEQIKSLIPTELRYSGSMSIEASLQLVIDAYIEESLHPDFLQTIDRENLGQFIAAMGALDRRIDGLRDSAVTSMAWSAEFKKCLDRSPFMQITYRTDADEGVCQACNTTKYCIAMHMDLIIDPVHPRYFHKIRDPSRRRPLRLQVGRVCGHRAYLYHTLKHYRYNLFLMVKGEVELIVARHSPAKPPLNYQKVRKILTSKGSIERWTERLKDVLSKHLNFGVEHMHLAI